jgi:hypothetical protein
MGGRLVRKGLVFGIIVLFIGLAVNSSTGFIVEKKSFIVHNSRGYIQDLIDNASTGLAPSIRLSNPSTGIAPGIINLESQSISGNMPQLPANLTMYGYNVLTSPHGEGPCKFDVENPGDIIQISNEVIPNFASGGAWTPDEKWIVCEYSNGELYEIYPETGDITEIGGGGVGLNGLAIDYITNQLYGASGNGATGGLWKIDQNTGEQEYVGDFVNSVWMIAIAFNAYGVLYGWDINTDYLYKIDKETGEATEVGPLGIDINYAQDGAFDMENDILYLTAFTLSPQYGGFLYECDEDTGACTLVGPFEGSAEIDASVIQWCWCDDHDVGIKDIISPVDGDASEEMEVIIQVRNYEDTEEDVPVNVVILKDGVDEEYNETVYIDIDYGETMDVEMPPWTPDDWHSAYNEYIDYRITAYIKLYGDDYPPNNYKEKWFELYFGYFHDVGCIKVIGPESGPAQTFPVNATIKNLGQYDECCFKTYIEIAELDVVSGLPLLPLEYSDFACVGEIDAGQEMNITFDNWTPAYLAEETSGTKMYSAKAWTDLNDPQDENPDNDLFEKTIELDYFHDVGINKVTTPNIYIALGNQNISTIIENIGTFPERDMTCYAEIYEFYTNCSEGTLVYEDNITDIDILTPLTGTKLLTFNEYDFAVEGIYRLDLNLVDDNDDYSSNNSLELTVGCDNTPPETDYELDPPAPDGLNGWYISDVEVTLTAADPSIGCDADGSGIKEIKYQIDGGAVQTLPGETGVFTVTTDSTTHTIKYWAIDNVSNTESQKKITFKQDQTPPVIDFTYEWSGNRPPYLFTFNATALDATSGMQRVEIYLNAELQETIIGPGPYYIWKVQYLPPCHMIIRAIAYDFAGLSQYDDIIDPKLNKNSVSQSISTSSQTTNIWLLEWLDRYPFFQKLLTLQEVD